MSASEEVAAADQPARRQPLVHEYVAEQLRREIALGLFAPRSSLPPERELAAVFGVGIMTVHRAIRLLESEVLVTSRRGRGGGTFVVGDNRDDGATKQLQERVRQERKAIEEALDCRMELEPRIVGRAAKHRTAADLAALRQLLDDAASTDDDVEFTKLDARFHIKIAQSAKNRFLTDALEQVRAQLYVIVLLLPDTPMWQQRTLTEHQRIFIALQQGDAEKASQAAARHVRHTLASARALLHSL
ncbi:MAG TPA: FCD domain-containing protein [Streptosporangiaceae bacterium]|jgi:GntR family transcriptional repressor for pyruvate dehydrogenase complex